MYIKNFANYGKGNVQDAIDYLNDDFDHKGRERQTEPFILHGDAQRLKHVCDNMAQKNKFVSGAMLFEEELTIEQMEIHTQEFIEQKFPGIDPSNLEMMWVIHNDHGRTEMNYIIAKVDLNTGKALNPFPPGWQEYSDAWRDMINEKYGYSRPDDLKNLHQPNLDYGLEQFNDKFKEKQMKRNEIVKEITKFIIDKHGQDGEITGRDDVIETLGYLEDLGIKVEKKSEKYISISVEGFEKNIRLKGNFYDTRNYNEGSYSFENSSLKDRPLQQREAEYRRNCGICNEYRQRTARYNNERFGAEASVAFVDVEREVGNYREIQLENEKGLQENKEAERIIKQGFENSKQKDIEIPEREHEAKDLEVEFDSSVNSSRTSGADIHPSSIVENNTSLDTDSGFFISTGHENETAQQKENRFQIWIDAGKRHEQKILKAAEESRKYIERLKHETEKHFSNITKNIFDFAGRSIPTLAGINNLFNKQNKDIDELKQRAHELTYRTRQTNAIHRKREQYHQTANVRDSAVQQRNGINAGNKIVYRINEFIVSATRKIGNIETKRKLQDREKQTDEEFYESLPEHQKKWYFDPVREFAYKLKTKVIKCPVCLQKSCECGALITDKKNKK